MKLPFALSFLPLLASCSSWSLDLWGPDGYELHMYGKLATGCITLDKPFTANALDWTRGGFGETVILYSDDDCENWEYDPAPGHKDIGHDIHVGSYNVDM